MMNLLKRMHLAWGAVVLIFISAMFSLAVYKINQDAITKEQNFQASACQLVDQANMGMNQTKVRIVASEDRSLKAAKAEQSVADIWKTAISESASTPAPTLKLVHELINAQETLAKQDLAAAADLHRQAEAVQPIVIAGC